MHTIQLSLFQGTTASLAGLESALKASMASIVAAGPLSREQVCDRMESIAAKNGVRICPNAKRLSVALFEKWLNPAEREHIPSIKAVQVFCIAMETFAPWAVILEGLGLGILTPEISHVYKIGQAQLDLESARKRLRNLKDKA